MAVCRGCLGSEKDMKNIFELNIQEEFSAITNIEVYRCEGLSEVLCSACRGALLACRDFRRRCQHADSVLKRQIFSSDVTEKSSETLNATDINKNTSNVQSIFDQNKLTLCITPKDSDLESDGNLTCPFTCYNIFTKRNHLISHLVKLHGLNSDKFTLETKYYCMYENCQYSINSLKKKHFTVRKTLKNHILNVHKNKNLICETCKMSFAHESAFERHKDVCEMKFVCACCNIEYKTNERLMVHLMRKHPDLHKEYKKQRKELKRKRLIQEGKIKKNNLEKTQIDVKMVDRPKRTLATQTLDKVFNDVPLDSYYQSPQILKHTQTEDLNVFTSNETQTVFEDLLSMRSHSEDEFETVSLSDIQTQTWPIDKKSNNETQTNQLLSSLVSQDLSFKETQTCFCFQDSPKPTASHFNFPKYIFDSANSSPNGNVTSTETQTSEMRSRDVLLSFNSIETQTNDDYVLDGSKLNI